jgi:coproporphyrinogen III oxidase-like Fe-S oxidoreductase
MMEEKVSVLAIGAGAISKRVFENKDIRIKRSPNVSNVKIYIERLEQMKLLLR